MINVISVEKLKKINVKSKKEIHIDKEKEFFDYINTKINEAHVKGINTVRIDAEDDVYDTYKLKKELKELGYKVSIYKKYEDYYMKYVPDYIIIDW